MLRIIALALALICAPAIRAAIWPNELGPFTRGSLKPTVQTDTEVWEEFGFLQGETAEYSDKSRRFTASAWRFRDPTGAMAAFQWQRPAASTPSKLGELAVETPASVFLAFHNYLLRIDNWKPEADDLAPFLERLPNLDQGSLPSLPGYVPAAGRIPNSERFVLGPASLAKLEPRIPPSVAAFHLGTEAQFAQFKSQAGNLELGLFSYPTPNFARERSEAFSRIPGALVKRAGPLVAVIVSPPDQDEAERLLSRVQYQATITWNEYTPTARDNVGNLILTIMTLCGLLILFCAAAGVAFGGFRILARRYLKGWADDERIVLLNLQNR
jgi:hypothetical protein